MLRTAPVRCATFALQPTPAESAEEVHNEADEQDQADAPATISRTAIVEAAAAKKDEQHDE